MEMLNKKAILVVLRDAGIIVVICAVVAIVVNMVRPDGIPLVQRQEYEIFVPCPEPLGEAKGIEVSEFKNLGEKEILVIDARDRKQYRQFHYPDAINIVFDYLVPVCKKKLKEVASSGAKMVIVYGDGQNPDSGEQMARELAGAGIKNVYFIKGGAPALFRGVFSPGQPQSRLPEAGEEK